YLVQTLGVVQLDTEEDIRLQIKLLCEALDNVKRRVNQIAGSNHLNPIDFPTRNELNEVKKVIMADIADIDTKYIKVQKEVGSLTLRLPALEKKVEGSCLGGGGSELVNRLVGLGLARTADVKDTENYLVDRGAGVSRQFDNLRREVQEFQGDVQANLEKLVTQFNSINKQLLEARREAAAPAAAAVAAAAAAGAGAGGGGGGNAAASAATAATAASAAATAAQTASEARAAVERERAERERETRELRERLSRAESHLGGALGELGQVVGAELGSVKEVMAALEAAMNQADAEALRQLRELDAGLRGSLASLERSTGEQSEMTGKVIMKMARQITEMQVKLKELAAGLAAAAAAPPPPGPTPAAAAPSPLPSPHMQQHPHPHPQQQQQQPSSQQQQHYLPHPPQQQPPPLLSTRESDPQLPFAARLLASQAATAAGGAGGGGGSGGGGAVSCSGAESPMNAPASPALATRNMRASLNGG
ncbi:hypothetical protein Agub_g12751, partial [Astrephomene gubernaculifera]